MNERLVQFLSLEQLSPARFADILGIQRSGISHILSGRNKPSFEFLEKIILKYPQLNLEWLITGKGKVYKEILKANPSHNNDLFSLSNNIDNTNNNTNKEVYSKLSEEENIDLNQNKSIIKEQLYKDKKLSKVILIYDDKTFLEYISED